jgi:hypothetical protein
MIKVDTAFGPPKRRWFAPIAFPVLLLCILAGCAGSPLTLEEQPAFELKSQTEIVSVSIREAWPGMSSSGFEALVKTGMLQALPGFTLVTPVVAPFPVTRLVWHVIHDHPTSMIRLELNRFEGSVPVAYAQQDLVPSSSQTATLDAIETNTRRIWTSERSR